MSKYIVEIPTDEEPRPIWEQRLWVAAYCRVSMEHEKQQYSLRNQIEFYTDYIRQNPCWHFVAVYFDTGSGLRVNNRPGCWSGFLSLVFKLRFRR